MPKLSCNDLSHLNLQFMNKTYGLTLTSIYSKQIYRDIVLLVLKIGCIQTIV